MTLDFKPRPDLPYMTRPEAERLRVEREVGETSFYRVHSCKGCTPERVAAGKDPIEVIKQKLYCSKACFEQHATADEQAQLAATLGRPLIDRRRDDDDEW